MYVRYFVLVKRAGVAITTMKFDSQFAAVASALAGPRILNGMSSTAQSQLMPCHPMLKNMQ